MVHGENEMYGSARSGKILPVLLKVCGGFVLWVGLTALLATALHWYELNHFDCNVPDAWFGCFVLLGILSGGPMLVAGVFSIKELPNWIKLVITVLCLFVTVLLGAVVGLLWLLSHMCP